MRVTEYARGFTWESTGYKGDNVSLALLSAEIKFYDFVLNDPKVIEIGEKLNDTPLTDDERYSCKYYIDSLKHRLNVTLPMLGFTKTFVNQNIKEIAFIRKTLNIKIVD